MSVNNTISSNPVRIHIGSISQSLADDIQAFQERLTKYGQVISPFELHKKPTLDTYFAFITLNITPAQLNSLKKTFNGNRFMGSTLTVATAKADFTERLEKRRQEEEKLDANSLLSHDQAKRLYSKQIQKKNVRDHIIYGRGRSTKRRDLKNATYRLTKINKDGVKVVVQVRCRKTKLWGFQKDKTLDALVYRYSNNQWRDGNGDIVEVSNVRLPKIFEKNSDIPGKVEKDENAEDEDEDTKEERERNLKIFEQMFGGGMEFIPKPISYKNDDEEEEEENEAEEESEENVESAKEDMSEESDYENLVESYNKNVRSSLSSSETYQEAEPKKEFESEKKEPTKDQTTEQPQESTTTSALRSLFNPNEESGGFSLFGGDEDDNDDNTHDQDIIMQDPIETKVLPSTAITNPVILAPLNPLNRGLFFAHSDSPFLHSQSQVAQLKTPHFISSAWEEEFWSKRGEWNREFRRHRRDVLRQFKKKNQGKRAVL